MPSAQLPGLSFSWHRFVRGVVHHLLQNRERRDGSVVERPEAVEHLCGPDEHAFSASFGQSDQVGHHGHGQVVRQIGRGVERAFGDQLVHQGLRF
jgi:hypothetical protein